MLFALCNDLTGIGFYSSGGDGNIIYWPNAIEDEGIMIARSMGQVMCLYLDEQYNRLLVGSLDGHLTVIDTKDHSLLYRNKVMKGGIFDFIKNDTGCFMVGDDGAVSQINEKTYQPFRGLQISHSRCRALCNINEYMYAGVTEGKIYKIDPLRLNEPIVSNSSHSGSVFSLLGFEDFIYSSGKDGKIIAWNNKLEKIDEIQAHNSTINSICMLGDSDIIASACRDGSIRLWQAATLELLKVIDLYLHSGHLRSVNKLLWNDHAKLLISCSDDKKIKTWQID